jgi:predicted Na+-dependent transporter
VSFAATTGRASALAASTAATNNPVLILPIILLSVAMLLRCMER